MPAPSRGKDAGREESFTIGKYYPEQIQIRPWKNIHDEFGNPIPNAVLTENWEDAPRYVVFGYTAFAKHEGVVLVGGQAIYPTQAADMAREQALQDYVALKDHNTVFMDEEEVDRRIEKRKDAEAKARIVKETPKGTADDDVVSVRSSNQNIRLALGAGSGHARTSVIPATMPPLLVHPPCFIFQGHAFPPHELGHEKPLGKSEFCSTINAI